MAINKYIHYDVLFLRTVIINDHKLDGLKQLKCTD